MSATITYSSESPTRAWLREHPDVVDAARETIETGAGRTPLADAVLADPGLLTLGMRTVLIQSIEQDAPPGVTEDLLLSYHAMAARVRTLRALPDVRAHLAELKGLRDPQELAPALRDRVEGVADADSIRVLDRLARLTDALAASDEMTVTELTDGSAVFSPDPSRLVDPGGPGPEPVTVDPGEGSSGPVVPDRGSPTETTEPTRVTATSPSPETLAPALLPADAETFAHDIGVEVAKTLAVPDPGAAAADAARAAFERFAASHSGAGSSIQEGLFTTLGRYIGTAVGWALGGPGGAALGAGIGARAGALIDHAINDPHFDATTALACILCGPTCVPCVLAAESGNTSPHTPAPVN